MAGKGKESCEGGEGCESLCPTGEEPGAREGASGCSSEGVGSSPSCWEPGWLGWVRAGFRVLDSSVSRVEVVATPARLRRFLLRVDGCNSWGIIAALVICGVFAVGKGWGGEEWRWGRGV